MTVPSWRHSSLDHFNLLNHQCQGYGDRKQKFFELFSVRVRRALPMPHIDSQIHEFQLSGWRRCVLTPGVRHISEPHSSWSHCAYNWPCSSSCHNYMKEGAVNLLGINPFPYFICRSISDMGQKWGKIKHVSLGMVVLAKKLERKCLFRMYSHLREENDCCLHDRRSATMG